MKLIANPTAGGGKVGREWQRVLQTLRSVYPGLEAVQTSHRGHASELAAAAIVQGHDTLLSLGGDGTHSEVAAGIAGVRADGSVSLGILHGGTGGDFSRLLGRGTLAQQAERLRDLPAHPIDLAKITWSDGRERVFLNEVSFGASAAICESVNRSSKRLGGRATFLLHTLKTLLRYRPQPIEIEVDGRVLRPGEIQTALLCNGQWAGGAMHFAPQARLADGQLDVTVICAAPLHTAALMTPRLYDGSLLQARSVVSDRGVRFRVRSLGEPLWVEADGEVLGQTPVEVEVLPGAVRLLGPPPVYL